MMTKNEFLENNSERQLKKDLQSNPCPKADVRIVWNLNEKGKIKEIEVAYFPRDKPEEWPIHMHKQYLSDLGNSCPSVWISHTLATVLIKFSIRIGFEDDNIQYKFLKDLRRIEEFREEIDLALYGQNLFDEGTYEKLVGSKNI